MAPGRADLARRLRRPDHRRAAFAVAWTPCVGPTLGSILTAASDRRHRRQGRRAARVLLRGPRRAVPAHRGRLHRATTAFRWLRDHYLLVTAVSGAVLIVMGVLLLTGELTRLNIEAQAALDDLGLDFIYAL